MGIGTLLELLRNKDGFCKEKNMKNHRISVYILKIGTF